MILRVKDYVRRTGQKFSFLIKLINVVYLEN